MLRMDFTSQEYLRDPAASLAKLRVAGPVVEVRFPIVGKTWITTNADLAARVLKDHETFTMRKNGTLAVCAGGCRRPYARSRLACCLWTNQTIRGCATLSTKRFVGAPFSTWNQKSSAIAEEARGRALCRRNSGRPSRALCAQAPALGDL